MNSPSPQASPSSASAAEVPVPNAGSAQSHVILAIFQAWQRAGVEFLVLRNYQALPEFVGNDIDVLVRPTARALAEQTLLQAARSCGFRHHDRAEFATLANYFYDPASLAQLHVDLFTDLKWRSFDFLRCDRFLAQRILRGTFFIPHPAHEAATNLLATMIYNGSIKDKYKASITGGFREHPDEARQLLSATYGDRLARFVVDAGAQERWTDLTQATATLRRSLIARQLGRHFFSVLSSVMADAARLLRRWLRPPGVALVLCGADGSGKSTVTKGLIDDLSTTFAPPKGRQFHWKPPIFSGRRMANRPPTTQPHARPPRNVLLSLVFFTFHWLEFLLGAFARIRPVTFRNGLVLIDRWYYDFFVDQRRYRLRVPLGLVRLGYAFLPKPDLVLLLDAPPEILHQRKAEVPLSETQRQREAYLSLIGRLPRGRIINAAQPPEVVIREIRKSVLNHMAERTEKRA